MYTYSLKISSTSLPILFFFDPIQRNEVRTAKLNLPSRISIHPRCCFLNGAFLFFFFFFFQENTLIIPLSFNLRWLFHTHLSRPPHLLFIPVRIHTHCDDITPFIPHPPFIFNDNNIKRVKYSSFLWFLFFGKLTESESESERAS